MSRPLPPRTESSGYPSGSRLHDEESRRKKAQKILAVLRDGVKGDLHSLRCLDVGCAAGLISYYLAGGLGHVVGLDPDEAALRKAPRRDALGFLHGDALCLPFLAGSFDVVICAQVYEHTSDPRRMMAEIRRVLKDDGVCFFSGPNRLSVIEYHYGLPLLHWLPVRWASWLLRLTGRGQAYGERPLTLGQLRCLLQGFSIEDYTVAMLRDPERYASREEIPLAGIVRHVPGLAWHLLYAFLPNYNWLLRKEERP